MTSWVIVGGGPSAKESLARVPANATRIGCNAALAITPLDIYWISDPVAVHRYRPLWRVFSGEIISNADLGRAATPWQYLQKGALYHGRCSGVLCCRVALERGATELHLVGFDGYKPEMTVEGVDGRPVARRGDQAAKVNEAQELAFADMADSYPSVAVTIYGQSVLRWPKGWVRL